MRKILKYKKEIFWCILILVVLMPTMYTILFAIPSADDFSMAYNIKRESLFSDSINRMVEYYKTWSGGWFYIFLESFLNPIVLFGASSGMLGVEMFCFFLLFIASLCTTFIVFGKKILSVPAKIVLPIIFAFLCIFINTEVYSEIYYWFVGSSYMWGVTLSLFTVVLIILFWTNGCKVRTGIVLTIIGVLACVSYQCAIFPGIIYMIFWTTNCYKEKRWKIKELIPLICMVIGGLSNVLAPGNYVRQSTRSDSGLQFITAIGYAWEDLWIVIGEWKSKPIIIAGMILFIIIGVIICSKVEFDFRYPLIPFILSIACCYIICYPVALGSAKVAMANRQYFVVNVYAMLSMCVSCGYLGGWISHHVNVSNKKLEIIIIGLIMITSVCLIPGRKYEELPYYQTIVNVDNVKYAADGWRAVFKEIEESEEVNLSVRAEYVIFDPPILRATQLTVDKEFWVNQAVAQYYGLNSFVMDYYNTPWGY